MNVWLVYESVGSSVMPVTYNAFDSRKAAVDYIMSELEGYSDYGRGVTSVSIYKLEDKQ